MFNIKNLFDWLMFKKKPKIKKNSQKSLKLHDQNTFFAFKKIKAPKKIKIKTLDFLICLLAILAFENQLPFCLVI